MKLAIIGATGTVGREIVRQAVGQGHEVTALSRSGTLGEDSPRGVHAMKGVSARATPSSRGGAGVRPGHRGQPQEASERAAAPLRSHGASASPLVEAFGAPSARKAPPM